MVLTYVLKSPRVGLADKAKPLTWLFYVVLPNFCFGDAIQNIYLNYQTLKLCSTVEPYCEVFKSPNPCCPGQSESYTSGFRSSNYLKDYWTLCNGSL